MATLKQISEAFGVSPMTVSNALNDRGGVSREKAEQIRIFADRLGYRPAYMAKSLLKGKTDTIGLCLRSSVSDPWFSSLIPDIQRQFRQAGFHLNLLMADAGSDEVKWALRFFAEFRVDAVIIGPLGFVDEYAALSDLFRMVPYVAAFDAVESLPIDHVRVDEYRGAEAAVNHLVERGHRDIGHIGQLGSEGDLPIFGTRYAGFCDALRRSRLPIRPQWLIPLPPSEDFPRKAITRLIQSGEPLPTAWLCHNDRYAALLIRLLDHFGLRVPEDVSVIGFDNQPIAELIRPALTTIGFNQRQYADELVSLVLEGLNRDDDSQKHSNRGVHRRQMPPTLIQRESVRSR